MEHADPFTESGAWGLTTAIDLHGCTPGKIRDFHAIRRYLVEVCALIDMKRFGEPTIVRFGADEKVAGYSALQLIETSLISGHFAETSNAAYIDIFSCKGYDVEKAVAFTQTFFGAKTVSHTVTYRY